MARRGGRKGAYLATDDYTGITVYANKLQKDYWGNMVVSPLKRNLQEISSPLDDPRPVAFYRGPTYERVSPCDFETQPLFIGKTNIRTPQSFLTTALNLDPGIGDATIGCTFVVH